MVRERHGFLLCGIVAFSAILSACSQGSASDPSSATNQPPTISGTPRTSVVQDRTYSFTPTAADTDNDPLIFGIDAKPAWATFDTATGQISGTPGSADVGPYPHIVVWVSDGKSQTLLPAFDLTVAGPDANRPPSVSGAPTTSVVAGTAYTFTPTASDPDDDPLTFSISNPPAWATFSATDGKLSGTPSAANVGTFADITISVSDGLATSSLPAFTITVTAPTRTNRPPTISGTPSSTARPGVVYTFQPTAADADSDPLTFTIANKPTWATFNVTTGLLRGTPAAGNVGTSSNIVISVSDGKASASLPAFSITVGSSNSPPVISGTPATAVQIGKKYTFTPTASDADAGTTLTFNITNKPSWATFDKSNGRLQGTPATRDIGTTSNIVISVSDGRDSAALPAFAITVSALPVGQAGFFTDLASAPVGASVTAYGAGFGTSGQVTLNGTVQQIVSYADTKVVFTVSGSGGALAVGSKDIGDLQVHDGQVLEANSATLKSVWATAQPGDVVYLAGGTYTDVYGDGSSCFDCQFDTVKQGTADQPIALVAKPGEAVVFQAAVGAPANFHLGNGDGSKARHLTIAGLHIIGDASVVAGDASQRPESGADYIRVAGNTLEITDTTRNTMTGLLSLQGDGWKVLGNTFLDSANRAIIDSNHAIYVQNGADEVEVAYNRLLNLHTGSAIQVDGASMLYSNVSIHDNLIEAVRSTDMGGIAVGNVADDSTFTIQRNTLRNIGQDLSGIAIYRGKALVQDNLFYATRAPNIAINGQGGGARQITATGNRFEAVSSYQVVQIESGASSTEITMTGNHYCGLPAPSQETNPLACN